MNFGIAKIYNGQCNLRFDDTNPMTENKEFVNSIKQDIEWLGFKINKDNIFYASDYFDQIYNYAIELINKNLAYVDDLTFDQIKEYRGTLTKPGIDSPYRNRTSEENIFLFNKMYTGSLPEGKACLRAKIDMSSKIIVMRDPVLYRIKFSTHYRTGNKWCIYPMYDFAHCISDSIECITHSLCTLEFLDNKKLYNWILDNISINNKPCQYEFSRLNLEYNILSKRKLQQLVNKKFVSGWDDPRMITISGLRKRGYTAESIINFCKKIGVTKQLHTVEFSLLEHCISSDLNKKAIRTMAVLNPIKMIIKNLSIDYKEIIYMPNHPNDITRGYRKVLFSREVYIDRADFSEDINNTNDIKSLKIGQEIRLRYSYIVKALSINKDKYNNITCIYCVCDINTLGKKPKDNRKINGVIHWVSVINALKAEFKIYKSLFTIKNPNDNKNFLKFFNKKSLVIKKGFIEKNLEIYKNLFYQFEREGYFYIDTYDKNKLVFNRTISLKKSKK